MSGRISLVAPSTDVPTVRKYGRRSRSAASPACLTDDDDNPVARQTRIRRLEASRIGSIRFRQADTRHGRLSLQLFAVLRRSKQNQARADRVASKQIPATRLTSRPTCELITIRTPDPIGYSGTCTRIWAVLLLH